MTVRSACVLPLLDEGIFGRMRLGAALEQLSSWSLVVSEESTRLESYGSRDLGECRLPCKKQNLIACHLTLRANWIEVKCADPRCALLGKTSAVVKLLFTVQCSGSS